MYLVSILIYKTLFFNTIKLDTENFQDSKDTNN